MPKIVFTIRIDPALKTAIERAAEADMRSVSSLVEKILAERFAPPKAPKRKD